MVPTKQHTYRVQTESELDRVGVTRFGYHTGLVCQNLTESGIRQSLNAYATHLDTSFASYILACLIVAGSLANTIVVTPRIRNSSIIGKGASHACSITATWYEE